MELLVGCGRRREKLIYEPGNKEWKNLVTLDINPDHKPDVLWNLEHMPLPFEDNMFDEIHAYEVLEHLGSQGNYHFFFIEWSEYWRILKPGGKFFGTVPSKDSVWALGDPSHTRIITPENWVFLHQPSYDAGVGKTPMSDFRYIYKADFDTELLQVDKNTHWFTHKAIKPSRCSQVK